MAIQISSISVINDQRELGVGLTSAYDKVTAVGVSTTLQNRDHCTVTTAGTTITLPGSPAIGNEVVIIIDGTFKNTVVARNGQNIMGLAENMTIDIEYAAMNFLFVNATEGWRVF